MSEASPSASAQPCPTGLAALRGLRTAPLLDAAGRESLRRELVAALAPQELAIEAPDDHDTAGADPAGAVFLKGNQRTGTFGLRPEGGLGEGILISGHHLDDPSRGDTWGPLPLDLFAQADA